jgi:hypothetical protein
MIGIHQVSNLLTGQINRGFRGPAKRVTARRGVTKIAFDRQTFGHFRRDPGIDRRGGTVIKVYR